MNKQQVQQNRETFYALCNQYIKRAGLDALLAYLDEKTDFFTAPSSTNYHLNEEGGLCQHSINVFRCGMAIFEKALPTVATDDSPFKQRPLTAENVAIATLFHDVCKTKMYHAADRWRKNAQGRWETYKGYQVKDDFPFGHGEKSCIIIERFMHLTTDELLAIRWHMGMYEIAEPMSISRHSMYTAQQLSPLVPIVQSADMLSANCLEITNEL